LKVSVVDVMAWERLRRLRGGCFGYFVLAAHDASAALHRQCSYNPQP
jgi:hypothetical protein